VRLGVADSFRRPSVWYKEGALWKIGSSGLECVDLAREGGGRLSGGKACRGGWKGVRRGVGMWVV